MFDAGIHTYVRWKVLGSVAWEGGVRGCACLSSNELVCCWTRSLVCTCMYVFCVLYGVVVYAFICDDIPNWSLRACRIE